ncbi:MAG: segregation/condensation protein A [Calditrichaeota bacterium]|nr:segregation/condensation protein A [Calditrichota bacterium]
MSYKVKLPVFEGPFDLLLFLIKKNEVDVYDIPIAEITRQYLEYIELMQLLDLDIAGEFIEMVATLMLIKVRMLLPHPETEDEEEIMDPRAQLVAQLLEYKQFKEASFTLGEMESRQRKYFSREIPNSFLHELNRDKDSELEDVSLFDLLVAFKQALDNMPKVTIHQVKIIKITIEDQVRHIFNTFGNRPYVLFREITTSLSQKIEVIVTFMAILDLIQLSFISAKQSEPFTEIRLVALQKLDMGNYMKLRDKDVVSEGLPGA